MTSFNMVGAEDNIILTGRPGDTAEADPEFYVYTKDIRESTTNVIGTDGTAAVSYSYDTFGETTEYQQDETDPFYNEICYTAGVYDKTTGLYNLSARYYDPADGTFLTQDTYRGSRSRTATLNYYAYCAGNPVSYTDPSGHAFWAVAGAAMGAYDGYQYAKKKNLKGWKKGAAIVGGALLGAVNPFKIVGKVGKVYKAVKAVKTAKKAKKTAKALKAVTKTPKKTVVTKKVTKVATAGNKTVKTTGVVKAQSKTVKGACFVAGTKVSTDKGFMPIEKIKPGDYVWSENPETNEKALKKVNKIFVREKDSIVRLSINGEIIETTDEHPFYVEGKGFVGAGALNYGDEVRLQSGDTAVVDDIDIVQLDESIKVYNFEVEDFHTYYVSEQEILVHNICNSTQNPGNLSLASTQGMRETELFLPDAYYEKLEKNIAKAIAARDEEVARIQSLSGKEKRDITTVVAGVDLRTGDVFVATKSSSAYSGLATCAEDIAYRGLGGNSMANIILTPAVRPRNGAIIPVCARCQTKYPVNQFVKGTNFQ